LKKAAPLTALGAMLLAASLSNGSAASDYPTKAISFVCWSSPGSPLDTMMRQLAKQMSAVLGQSVSVQNRTGGSGAVAMSYVMSQPANGYTVLSTTSSMTFTMAQGRVPFQPDNFVVLPPTQSEPSAVAVLADSQFKTLKNFVDYLHMHPNGLKVGGYASAGFNRFVFDRLQHQGDFKAAWIPFDGGNQAALALLGGHIDVAVMTPSSALSQVESGKIRLLGISTAARDPYFPNIPTFKEQGYNVVESIWRGTMVKAGTPKPAIDTLLAAEKKVAATDEWQKFMKTNYQLPLTVSLDGMQKQVRDEVAARRQFLKDNGFIK
jgi:putative tricarboxylic transport membrane protein